MTECNFFFNLICWNKPPSCPPSVPQTFPSPLSTGCLQCFHSGPVSLANHSAFIYIDSTIQIALSGLKRLRLASCFQVPVVSRLILSPTFLLKNLGESGSILRFWFKLGQSRFTRRGATPSSQPAGYSRRLGAEILHHRAHSSVPAARPTSHESTRPTDRTASDRLVVLTLIHPRFARRQKEPSLPRRPGPPDYKYILPTDGESGRFEWRDLLFRGPTSTLAGRQIINRSCQSDAIQPSIMSGFVEEAAPNVFWQGPLEV